MACATRLSLQPGSSAVRLRSAPAWLTYERPTFIVTWLWCVVSKLTHAPDCRPEVLAGVVVPGVVTTLSCRSETADATRLTAPSDAVRTWTCGALMLPVGIVESMVSVTGVPVRSTAAPSTSCWPL